MADITRTAQVTERLRASIAGGLFTAAVLPRAQSLLDRFDRPLRLALMGLPAVGKSAVLNLLVGETIVPTNLSLPSLQLRQGATPVMTLAFADGTTDQRPGRDLGAAANLGPMSVILELPLQSLALMNPMELSAGESVTDQARAINWASKHADIFIWCSETFSESELALWRAVPTVVKDQGLLLITKTDLLGGFDKVPALINRIFQVAGDDFARILPLSAELAKQAFAADGSFDRDMFRTSGAPGLIAEIRLQIEKLRQADTDTAIMMLLYSDAASADVKPQPVAPAVPKPVASKPVTRPVQKLILTPQVAVAPVASPTAPTAPPAPAKTVAPPSGQVRQAPAPFSAQLAQLRSKPAGEKPADEKPVVPAAAAIPDIFPTAISERPRQQELPPPSTPTAVVARDVTAQEEQLLSQAITSLVNHANIIQSSLPVTGKTQWPKIVSQTAEAVLTVGQLLQNSKSPAPRTIAKEVTEIQDLLMLIQLEQGAAPAHDAINLLIQLKRDLEFALAA